MIVLPIQSMGRRAKDKFLQSLQESVCLGAREERQTCRKGVEQQLEIRNNLGGTDTTDISRCAQSTRQVEKKKKKRSCVLETNEKRGPIARRSWEVMFVLVELFQQELGLEADHMDFKMVTHSGKMAQCLKYLLPSLKT